MRVHAGDALAVYRIPVDFVLRREPLRARARERATFDGCSLDMTRYEYSGDRDKRIEWAERDETMDRRSTSRNTIASASRRIVCFALISAPSSRFFSSLAAGSFFPKDHLRPPPPLHSPVASSLSLPSFFFFLPVGGILFVINLTEVTLITAQFYLSHFASTSLQVALLRVFSLPSFLVFN